MSSQLKTAIRYEIPSPESEFIIGLFPDADVFDPWTVPTESYDLAICVGPVKTCPPAKKRVLFVMGMTLSHSDLNWDTVVVTSPKAVKFASSEFGLSARCKLLIPPVLQLDAGKRRIVFDKREVFIHASEIAGHQKGVAECFHLWAIPEKVTESFLDAPPKIFTAMEFNSLIRGGAKGIYPDWMGDGYDVQVRRHLALGGRVKCRPDREVIGDYADLIGDTGNTNGEPVIWPGTETEYADGIHEIIRKV